MNRAALCLIWSCVLCLSDAKVRAEPLPSALAPEPSHTADEPEFPAASRRAYQRLMQQGVAEFGLGHWAEARALFGHGHDLLPNARSFRVLGMTAFNLAQYPAALRELDAALSDPRRPLRGSLREQTELLRERAETFVGRFRVALEPAGAQLRVDGLVTQLDQQGTLLLAVGERLLEADAPGYVPFARTLVVDGRDDGLLVMRLRSLARSTERESTAQRRSQSALPVVSAARGPGEWLFGDYRFSWGFGAGTVALGSTAIALLVKAGDEARALEARCQGDCRPWDDVAEKRDKLERWTQGLAISACVLAVATIVTAVLEHEQVTKRAAEQRKMRLQPL